MCFANIQGLTRIEQVAHRNLFLTTISFVQSNEKHTLRHAWRTLVAGFLLSTKCVDYPHDRYNGGSQFGAFFSVGIVAAKFSDGHFGELVESIVANLPGQFYGEQ